MVEKMDFIVFRSLIYLRYISNQDDLIQEEALSGALLQERERT